MKTVIFDHCFGWLHERKPAATRGVVLCQPFGREAMWVHKGWRVFAEALADLGAPTLRFDYAGTGDSAGESEDGEQMERWLRSIRSAITYLKESTGVTQVVLCGLRLGATLAALVAAEEEVDQLVLLAPVLSDKQYLRELRLLQQNWLETSGIHVEPPPADADYVEAVGHRLIASSAATLASARFLRSLTLEETRRCLQRRRSGCAVRSLRRMRRIYAGIRCDRDTATGNCPHRRLVGCERAD